MGADQSLLLHLYKLISHLKKLLQHKLDYYSGFLLMNNWVMKKT